MAGIEGADFYHNAKPLAQAYVLAEIERLNLARELAGIKEGFKKVLIGGNSLASVLVSWCIYPNEIKSVEEAQATLTYAQYEVWLCWKTIMDNRELIGS